MRWTWLVFAVACGSPHQGGGGGGDGGSGDGSRRDGPDLDTANNGPRTIFVIPMENESANAIYGSTNAPYINGLFATAAHATMFQDELPSLNSEPHYVWMEAGTNAFTDHTFTTDNDSSSGNSTNSTAHLVTQLQAANISWMSYQEDIAANTCPISSSGFYAAKHDPFVFFQDVVGSPPSASNTYCIAHHKPYTDFAGDLAAGTIAQFVFITPNLCDDMHGASGCPGTNDITTGDTWLSNELPRILTYAAAHDSVVMLTWDEGSSNNQVPFLILGPRIKINSTSTTTYTHSSQLKSIEEILGVPVLSTVSSANDFADMFQSGMFP
jgi:hypothetical protein